jgi:hypothetical protein
MASVSVSPFLTVPVGPATVGFPPAPPVDGLPWDMSATLCVSADVVADTKLCREAAGLPFDAPLAVALVVWCDATYWSTTASKLLGNSIELHRLSVEVPAGSVYGKISHHRLLVLAEDVAGTPPEVAHRRGSVLASSPPTSIQLTGEGGQFPTSVKDFAATGLPGDAPWYIAFSHESPDDPVLGTVTLWLNNTSPTVKILLGVVPAERVLVERIGRELRQHVVSRLLREAVADERVTSNNDWPDHSVGALLSDIASRFSHGRSILDLRALAEHDRDKFEAVLAGVVPDVL